MIKATITSPNTKYQAKYLTDRQIEILLLVAKGKRSAEIANQLMLSKHTVDNHRKNMLRKTGQSNSIELVNWAGKNGLLKNA